MCGIAGVVRFAGLRPDEHGAGRVMADTLRHRGPDDAGHYADRCASLGHARLSIIDLDAGRQPMANEDGTIHVVFNGEIYNHQALAEQLRARGHRLRTRCDTEVLAHLYEDHGESFVEHLNGMFAIALWDSRRRLLILARDRLGIKPLYWHDDGCRIAFGSEFKALLVLGDAGRRIDELALHDYLTFGHVPAPRTIFRNMRKLEPGCLAVCTETDTALRRYWDIPFAHECSIDAGRADANADDRGWVDAFAALLEDAVGIRLMADVPLGAFLSGGVDSTAIVAAMSRRGAHPVSTQTVGFDEAGYNEQSAARAVADVLGTDHREVMVRPDAVAAVEELVHHYDEPFAAASAVPVLYLSRAARQRVTVALSGDGGDEMLAGYRRYRFDLGEAAFRRRFPHWLRRSTAGMAGRLYPKADWLPRPLRAKVTLQNLAHDDATAHLRSVAIRAGTLPDLLMRPELIARHRGYEPFLRGRELFARCRSPEPLERFLYLDMKTQLPDEILTKVDRASMAVGLEVRVPLLDHRIVELAARMPTRLKLDRGRGKRVLRDTLAAWMSTDVADRPKKGFDVPLEEWFRGPLRAMANDLLLSPRAACHEWIEPRAVRRVITDHEHRRRSAGQVLWTLLSLEQWARSRAADAKSPVHPLVDAAVVPQGSPA